MTTREAVALILGFLALWAVVTLAERVCGVLVVRRHRFDGLTDKRVLRSVRVTRRARPVSDDDPAEGY